LREKLAKTGPGVARLSCAVNLQQLSTALAHPPAPALAHPPAPALAHPPAPALAHPPAPGASANSS
jgi:hypothetical protein